MEDTGNNQAAQSAPNDLSLNLPEFASSSVHLPKLLLASSSPRRSQILRMVGWPFEVCAVDVDESLRSDEKAEEYVERLALAKAQGAAERYPSSLILAADTTVVIDEEILGKPGDALGARQMLQSLQGRWHEVLTGIALISDNDPNAKVSHEITEVKFAAMSAVEINWYVETGEPMDKAGAYAIQGQGARFIEAIKGDYFNVMGLPLRLLYRLVMSKEGLF
jgi:septum formation protein